MAPVVVEKLVVKYVTKEVAREVVEEVIVVRPQRVEHLWLKEVVPDTCPPDRFVVKEVPRQIRKSKVLVKEVVKEVPLEIEVAKEVQVERVVLMKPGQDIVFKEVVKEVVLHKEVLKIVRKEVIVDEVYDVPVWKTKMLACPVGTQVVLEQWVARDWPRENVIEVEIAKGVPVEKFIEVPVEKVVVKRSST